MNAPGASTGWGFIGASTIASEHMIAAVRAQAGHDVVALSSGDAVRARSFAQDHGIRAAYGDVPSLLLDPAVQVIYISSTNDRHAEQALAAIDAGKHVLCEKPLSTSLAQARRMVESAQAAGVLFATNHHLRNAATHRKMREVVQGGLIGRPLFARIAHAIYLREKVQGWRIEHPEAGGGVILDIATHGVDTLRFVLGTEPVEAVGMSQRGTLSRNGVEDGAMAVLRMSDGVLAQIHTAYTVGHATTGLEVHGECGSVQATDCMTTRAAGDVTLRTAEGTRQLDLMHESLYAAGVRRFCEALEGNGEPAASGIDGVRSLEAALAIAQACKTGRAVPIGAVASP